MADLVKMRDEYLKVWLELKPMFLEKGAKDIHRMIDTLKGDKPIRDFVGLCVGVCGLKAILEELEEDILNGKKEEENG